SMSTGSATSSKSAASSSGRMSSLRGPGATARGLKRRRLLEGAGLVATPSEASAPTEDDAHVEDIIDQWGSEDDLSDEDAKQLVDDGSSDDSEDDAPRNRIGNVPLHWYKDEDHVGYDIGGEKIVRTLSTGEIDMLLESKDNPDAWRTIKDHKNQREVVLTDTDLEVIRRIRQ
ncbi:unnamed protein product, partial [Polarella glacialis]